MEEIYKENQEIITKIVDMMDKFIEWFELIEDHLWQCDKTMTRNENTQNPNTADQKFNWQWWKTWN